MCVSNFLHASRYTNRAAVMDFEPALAAWEGAAAAVLQREALLAQLVDLRRLMKAATEASAAKAAANAARAAEEATGVRSQGQHSGAQQRAAGRQQQQQQDGKQSVKAKNGPSVALPDVQQLLWAFLVSTEQVKRAMVTRCLVVCSLLELWPESQHCLDTDSCTAILLMWAFYRWSMSTEKHKGSEHKEFTTRSLNLCLQSRACKYILIPIYGLAWTSARRSRFAPQKCRGFVASIWPSTGPSTRGRKR